MGKTPIWKISQRPKFFRAVLVECFFRSFSDVMMVAGWEGIVIPRITGKSPVGAECVLQNPTVASKTKAMQSVVT